MTLARKDCGLINSWLEK